MPITISGSTGIAGVDGSASTPAIQGTDTNTGVTFPAADTVAVSTGGSERMRVDSSGNVGIGTSSPNNRLAVHGAGATIRINDTNTTNDLYITSNSDGGILNVTANANLIFKTANAERARFDSSGNLLVGTTTTGGGAGCILHAARGGTTWNYGPATVGSGNNFYVLNSSSTGVYLASGNTSWTANSDERLKTDLVPIENAAEKVSTLRAVTGRYKTDEEGKSRAFLIAQDVQKVLPEAVNVQGDEQGTLGLQYTDVIPLLVAAIQELNAKVEGLQAEINALKGAA